MIYTYLLRTKTKECSTKQMVCHLQQPPIVDDPAGLFIHLKLLAQATSQTVSFSLHSRTPDRIGFLPVSDGAQFAPISAKEPGRSFEVIIPSLCKNGSKLSGASCIHCTVPRSANPNAAAWHHAAPVHGYITIRFPLRDSSNRG